MSSDISSIHSSTQAAGIVQPRVVVPETSRQGVALAVKPMDKPQISAPKPNQINFDPAKLREDLSQAVSLLNQQMTSTKQGLGFTVDHSVPVPIVTVRNISTGEVVRQLPSEEAVKMAHHLDSIKGFLHNTSV